MESQSTSQMSSEYYNIQFLIQSGAIQVYQNIYNDAFFQVFIIFNFLYCSYFFLNTQLRQLITSASSLANSTLSSFLNTDIQSTQKNFFYVQVNGLGILRRGSEYIAGLFYNFYYGLSDSFQIQFLIIMILGIVFLMLSITVLIPIVFSVHRTNNRVLSLFGSIPLLQIRELATKCEKYIVDFLEDKNEKKEEFEEDEEQTTEEESKN